jgi:hypothetical protein
MNQAQQDYGLKKGSEATIELTMYTNEYVEWLEDEYAKLSEIEKGVMKRFFSIGSNHLPERENEALHIITDVMDKLKKERIK